MKNKIMVIAAHSDDEVIGCAGSIMKHIDQGDQVHLVFMTDGVGSRNNSKKSRLFRKELSRKSADLLQVTSMVNFDFPDNRMDTVSLLSIVKTLEEQISSISPNIIYTHHNGDLNIDHQVTNRAVMTASRPLPKSSVKKIFSFEVISSTEWNIPNLRQFSPDTFVDITKYIKKKIELLEIYNLEMRPPPHSRNIQNIIRLNALRGNSVGVDYAEAFSTLRSIW